MGGILEPGGSWKPIEGPWESYWEKTKENLEAIRDPWEIAIDDKIDELRNVQHITVAAGFETVKVQEGWYCRSAPFFAADGKEVVQGEVHWTKSTGALFISGRIVELHRTMRSLGHPLKEVQRIRLLGMFVASYVPFSNMSRIYDNKDAGTHEIYGAILQKWLTLRDARHDDRWPSWPTTGELGTPDGRGRFNHFENGSIYWTPTTGAHFIGGPCRDRWAELGWENSYLGYPIADTDNGTTVFERGKISVVNGQAVEFPDRRVIHSGTVHTPDGFPVNGWAQLTIYSNGGHQYRGKIHTSGAPSYDVAMAMVPLVTGYTRSWFEKGDVEGSLVLGGSRDHPWDHGLWRDQWIQDNWEQLKECEFRTILRVDFGPGDLLAMIGTVVGVPAALLGAAVLGAWAPDHVDPCGRIDENGNPEAAFVGKGRPCPDGFHK
ncbi:LGFP repeat-containing protein [Nocardia takedensis]